jgi:integrase
MSVSDSTKAAAPSKAAKVVLVKPVKPYPEFPLFPHATKRWAKKIRGRFHFFGRWDEPDKALAKYNEQKEALHAGRRPRPANSDGVVVRDVVNNFLTRKKALRDSGEISVHTFANYRHACVTAIAHFGERLVSDLDPQDFATFRDKMAKRWGYYRLTVTVQHIRSIFKYAYEAALIPTPVRFGPTFKGPSRRAMRIYRAAQGEKLFTPSEIRSMLDGATVKQKSGEEEFVRASVQMRAMILLAVNCGFGNSDCGNLPMWALDLDKGWVNFPRPKTGIPRRCPLWPETVQALRDAIASRPESKRPEDAGRVFVTRCGAPWVKGEADEIDKEGRVRGIADRPITKEMRKLLDRLNIGGKRTFYTFRHVFETIGGESRDQVAVNHIMGHADVSMAAIYRERISDARLRVVADFVRAWLFQPTQP